MVTPSSKVNVNDSIGRAFYPTDAPTVRASFAQPTLRCTSPSGKDGVSIVRAGMGIGRIIIPRMLLSYGGAEGDEVY